MLFKQSGGNQFYLPRVSQLLANQGQVRKSLNITEPNLLNFKGHCIIRTCTNTRNVSIEFRMKQVNKFQ